jgi:hypothetical protein
MPITTTTLDIAAAALGLFILQQYLKSRGSTRLPPGPKGLPLIGVRHKNFCCMPCNSNPNLECSRYAVEQRMGDVRRVGTQMGYVIAC